MGRNTRKSVPNSALPHSTDGRHVPRKLAGVVPAEHDHEANERKPAWGFSLVDHDEHPWASWPNERAGMVKILMFLQSMERLAWREIRAQMTGGRRRGALHKPIPVENIISAAQSRLTDLELDEYPELFRFRLGNMERLWGVFVGGHHVFYPVWWDPEHKICPSKDR